MKCPVCKKEMTEEDFGGVKVDVCTGGCRGIWFDWLELLKLDENNEGCGDALKKALQHPRSNDDKREKLKCPKCGIDMQMHIYQTSDHINVDECYICGGFFLDSGELRQIREEKLSDDEEKLFISSILEQVPSYKKTQEEEDIRKKAVERLSGFLKNNLFGKNG